MHGELTSEIIARGLHDKLDGNHGIRVMAIDKVIEAAQSNGYTIDGWTLRNGDKEVSMHGDWFAKRVNEEIAKIEASPKQAKLIDTPRPKSY